MSLDRVQVLDCDLRTLVHPFAEVDDGKLIDLQPTQRKTKTRTPVAVALSKLNDTLTQQLSMPLLDQGLAPPPPGAPGSRGRRRSLTGQQPLRRRSVTDTPPPVVSRSHTRRRSISNEGGFKGAAKGASPPRQDASPPRMTSREGTAHRQYAPSGGDHSGSGASEGKAANQSKTDRARAAAKERARAMRLQASQGGQVAQEKKLRLERERAKLIKQLEAERVDTPQFAARRDLPAALAVWAAAIDAAQDELELAPLSAAASAPFLRPGASGVRASPPPTGDGAKTLPRIPPQGGSRLLV